MKDQCHAVTLASTYSDAHRCLKKIDLSRAGKKIHCAHHLSMGARSRA